METRDEGGFKDEGRKADLIGGEKYNLREARSERLAEGLTRLWKLDLSKQTTSELFPRRFMNVYFKSRRKSVSALEVDPFVCLPPADVNH